MHSLSRMELEEKAEIRCMTIMRLSNLIATGHEDGSIRLWNMEIFENVPLKCDSKSKHSNSIGSLVSFIYNDVEFLGCADYNGRISIWQAEEKKSTLGGESQISVYLRQSIDNMLAPNYPESCVENEIFCMEYNTINSVSYTHLTLPTKRIV